MKNIWIIIVVNIFTFSSCQKEADLYPVESEIVFKRIEWSKEESADISPGIIPGLNKANAAYKCPATLYISEVKENNPQLGFWKVRIHSNSWWAETYYEFSEAGIYQIALPSDSDLSIAFSAGLVDWNCKEASFWSDDSSGACNYRAFADLSFSLGDAGFYETFEASASPNASVNMSAAFNSGDCEP